MLFGSVASILLSEIIRSSNLPERRSILYFVDWTRLDWTGLVKRGLVKLGLVKRGLRIGSCGRLFLRFFSRLLIG